MRAYLLSVRTVKWCAVFFGLASIALAARAPEWLKPLMAEDVAELGKGKTAVRLLDSSDVKHLPDNRVKRVDRGALRILTDQGRKEAICVYGFNADTEKVVAARAWLISADGKTVKDFSTNSFVDVAMQMESYFWPQQRIMSYSAKDTVMIGGVFAWEFEVESQTGITDVAWRFPTDLPTLLSALEVAPSPGGKLTWHATQADFIEPVAGATPGAQRWERRRSPALTASGDLPTGFLPTRRYLSVRNIPANNGAIQTWTDLAGIAAGVIEPQITLAPGVKAKAEALVAGKTERWERVRALAQFVQKEISYLGVVLDPNYLAGYRPHPAGEVLQNRYGDCKDKASLFVSLLRAIGDEGRVVLVSAGDPKAVQLDWPSAMFNHAIAGVPADDAVPAGWPVVDAGPLGKLVLFDATDPDTPLGTLPSGDQGGFGLVVSAKATGLITLPIAGPELNRVETVVKAKLDGHGTLTAAVEETSSGSIGVARHATRENLRNERYTPILEGQLRETLSFMEDLHWKDTWDAPAARWRMEFDFKAPRYARRTGGNLMLISPQVMGSSLRLSPWKTKLEGVAWRGASTRRKQVRLTLPEGMTVEEVPDDWKATTAAGEARLKYTREGSDVIYESELTLQAGFLDQTTYEAVRGFLQKMQEAERRPVLVRLDAAATATAPAK